MTSALDSKRIGFIGCGAMARALAGGLIAAGIPSDRIRAADPIAEQRQAFLQEIGVSACEENADVVGDSDVIVIAVKPNAVATVLQGLAGSGDLTRPVWISIAAGTTLASIGEGLPGGSRIIRAMPNTPALVGAGATAYAPNPAARDDDLAAARALFEAVGTAWQAPSEAMLDAVTGLSGSGPAYVFLLLEALSDAGVRVGLPRAAAQELACQTVLGSTKLVIETGRHPAELKDQVTSPGGTTIAGLEQLEAGGVRAAIYRAVAAATARSRELSGS
jgi:pyrroline-5-carboxylate reductase